MIAIFVLSIITWLLIKSRIELAESSSKLSCIQIIECSHGYCLCKPNNLIAHSSWVMFYETSGDFEKKIAFGIVETITTKGVAQIRVFPIDDTSVDILNYINNEKNRILIRPTITTEAIQQISTRL